MIKSPQTITNVKALGAIVEENCHAHQRPGDLGNTEVWLVQVQNSNFEFSPQLPGSRAVGPGPDVSLAKD